MDFRTILLACFVRGIIADRPKVDPVFIFAALPSDRRGEISHTRNGDHRRSQYARQRGPAKLRRGAGELASEVGFGFGMKNYYGVTEGTETGRLTRNRAANGRK